MPPSHDRSEDARPDDTVKKTIDVTPPPRRRRTKAGLIFLSAIAIVGLGLGGRSIFKQQEQARLQKEEATLAKQAAVAAEALVAERSKLFGDRGLQRGVTFRANGLGFRVMLRGTWAAPRLIDVVRITYSVRLKDGQLVDQLAKPTNVRMTDLLPGLAAGLQLIQPGGQIELFIPPALGYGDDAKDPIPAGSGLIYDVSLIAVNP